MSIATETFVREVAQRSECLQTALDEHVEDNLGEVLPHVFLADVTRRLVSWFAKDSAHGELSRVLDLLEDRFREGGDEIQELIAVSFLENLPQPGADGHDIRNLLGPRLTGELARLPP